jgi:ElaA protein
MIHTSLFQDLSSQNIYDILRLRQDVFMLEQHCFYEDIDGRDVTALHVRYLEKSGQLIGYLRILPPENGSKLSIGRVVVAENARRQGIGREIMEAALKECRARHPHEEIHLSAQTHLIDFYASFGFQKIGNEYMEAGIPHQEMTLLTYPERN